MSNEYKDFMNELIPKKEILKLLCEIYPEIICGEYDTGYADAIDHIVNWIHTNY